MAFVSKIFLLRISALIWINLARSKIFLEHFKFSTPKITKSEHNFCVNHNNLFPNYQMQHLGDSILSCYFLVFPVRLLSFYVSSTVVAVSATPLLPSTLSKAVSTTYVVRNTDAIALPAADIFNTLCYWIHFEDAMDKLQKRFEKISGCAAQSKNSRRGFNPWKVHLNKERTRVQDPWRNRFQSRVNVEFLCFQPQQCWISICRGKIEKRAKIICCNAVQSIALLRGCCEVFCHELGICVSWTNVYLQNWCRSNFNVLCIIVFWI